MLHHVHNPDTDLEDVKLIGVYSSKSSAEVAVARLAAQPGFDQPDGRFEMDEYQVDRDHWEEGFVTLET